MNNKVMQKNSKIKEVRLETMDDFEEKLNNKSVDYFRGELILSGV